MFFSKNSLKSWLIFSLAILITIPSLAFASPQFTPGQTLNPGCSPSNPDCSIIITNPVSSQWTTNSSDIYYNSGKVGIGVTVPGYKLDVNGDANVASGSHFKINGTNLSSSDIGAQASSANLTSLAGLTYDTSKFVKMTGANTFTLVDSATATLNNVLTSGASSALVPTLSGGIITPKIYPAADSTTAFQINKTDGTTNVLNVDTTNSYVGIGTASPAATLDVAGKFKVGTADAYSGTGTGTAGAPRIFLGTNASSNDDSAILIGRNVAGNNLFSHAIRDESTFISGPLDSAYASFDSNPVFSGPQAYNHFTSFQARPNFHGSTSVGEMNGFTANPIVASGVVSNLVGLHISDATGAGTVTLQTGIYIDALAKGTTNYGIYQAGTSPNYFGGSIQTGGGITIGGVIKGSNLYTTNANNNVGFGIGTPADGIGYYEAFFGHNAGHSLLTGNYNTFIGYASGYTTNGHANNTYIGAAAGYTGNGDNNVFVGQQAGYYETGSNKLFIDNAKRTNEADARTKALLYGIFDATTANQYLTLNGQLQVTGIGNSYISGRVGIGTTAPTTNLQVSQGTTGPGTVSNSAGGTTVTGVGTQFTNTFKVGDTITIPASTGQAVVISAIASDTSMTTAAITNLNSAVAYSLAGGTRFNVLGNGNVGVGTATPAGALDVTSTTGGFIVPRMTTTQKNALTPVNGMIIYDTTLNKFQGYENGAWANLI